jgi:GAF domain-containing protein
MVRSLVIERAPRDRSESHPSKMVFEDQLTQMAIATADASHEQIHRSVREVLQLMRAHLEMDVAFVSKFEDGRRVFKHVDASTGNWVIEAQQSDKIEQSFCQRVLDSRLPQLVHDVRALPNFADLPYTAFPIGAHMSVPIVLPGGAIYGTLCCFSFAPNHALAERDLKRLRMAADMMARLIAKSFRDEDDATSD